MSMQVLQFAILGLGTGAIFALLGQAVVIVNLGSGLLNFAAGALGMVGAYVFYGLSPHGVGPTLAALLGALATAAAMGAAFHLLVMRRLAAAPAASRIVASLGLMTLLLECVSTVSASKGAAEAVQLPLPSGAVSLGSGISVGVAQFVIAGIAVAVTAVLVAAQRRTRLGLATSAVAENRVVVSSMGWSPDLIGAMAWAIGSVIAAGAAILAAGLSSLSASDLTLLVVPSMAAALVGGMQRFGWTLAGGLAIGIAESEVSRYVSSPGWVTAAPLLVVVAVLTVRGTSLPARTEAKERRPVVGTGRIRPAFVAAAVVCIALSSLLSVTWLNAVTTTALFAIVILSLVVLTGYAGQLSLAQIGIAGMGAFLTAFLAEHTGAPLALAVIAAVAMCTPLSFLVALPSLRTRGSTLAIATLSLAVAIDSLVISNPELLGSLAGKDLGTLNVFGLDLSALAHPAAFEVAALAILLVLALAVANLRRGRSGRRLLAVRSNERAAAAMGISVAAVKVYAFWLASMIAALAGALLEARFSVVDFSSFQVLDNVNLVLFAIIGGIGWIAASVVGALGVAGGVTGQLLTYITASGGTWLIVLGAIGAITVVLQSPDGLAPLFHSQIRGAASFIRGLRGGPAPSGDSGPRRRQTDAGQLAPATARQAVRTPSRLLELRDVTVRFGSQRALGGVSLRLGTGELVGLIGPNGAGKSTLIDVVTGFQRVGGGTVLLDGRPIDRLGPARRARAGISRSFQSLELFDDMTVLENLRTAADRVAPWDYVGDLAWPRQSRLTEATAAAIEVFRLETVLDRRPAELDYGKRRLVAIARALSAAPALLLLDEPAAGLGQQERQELAELLRLVSAEWGIGVLLVEHDVQMVFSTCERVVVLDQGRAIASGPAAEVRRSSAVVAAYLGSAEPERAAAAGPAEPEPRMESRP
jgi:ABC-type branched-subunit amino acid transport system ATPase component/ABC-type branched-subunit amino acid transport system permease subunit